MRITIRVLNTLDLDPGRQFVEPDLDINSMQRYSAEKTLAKVNIKKVIDEVQHPTIEQPGSLINCSKLTL